MLELIIILLLICVTLASYNAPVQIQYEVFINVSRFDLFMSTGGRRVPEQSSVVSYISEMGPNDNNYGEWSFRGDLPQGNPGLTPHVNLFT